MSEVAASSGMLSEDGAEKRRTTRVICSVPITVLGTDALGQPFREMTGTLLVDCYGCKFSAKHYMPKNSTVTLEIRGVGSQRPARVVRARVAWIQRPRTHRENFQVAVEMEVPGNVWGVSTPPKDWFPHPDDVEEVAVAPAAGGPRSTSDVGDDVDRDKVLVEGERDAAPEREIRGVTQSQTSESEAEASGFEEITFTREQLDGRIQDAILRTVRVLSERVTEAVTRDVIQELAEHTAFALEETRKLSEAVAEELDTRVRQVLDEILSTHQVIIPKLAARKHRGSQP